MNFLEFLDEAKEQLDISIQAAGKYLTNASKIESFLSSTVEVEHKTDGVKLTVIKKANKGTLDDYVFAYKGNILYSSEFDWQPKTKIKKESIGQSQFRTVFDHFKKLGKNSIPVDTELFIEFLMSKPTLSSNYNTKHKMVLIGYSKSSWEEKFGKLKTKPVGMKTDNRDKIAKELKIDIPQFLFQGVLGSPLSFSKGIKNKNLKAEFESRKNGMTWDNPEILLDDIRQLFLAVESKYGGKEEGVVIKYDGRLLKWQQEYQLDQTARMAIKAKYREETREDEDAYWNNVNLEATRLAAGMVIKSRKLEDLLSELSSEMRRLKVTFTHSKKSEAQIKDDIQLNAKTQIIKQMRGNNNALILGKFRVVSKEGHAKLFKRAQTLYDNLVICIVSSKDTADTKALREEMVRKVAPKAEIIHHANGNILGILGKSPININAVYAGSDRVASYKNQVRTVAGLEVKEMPRTDSDISASKIIANIDDKEFFEKNTPPEIHSMYNKIKKAYK